MSFTPQYSYWSKESFTVPTGFTLSNPGQYEIVDGVAKLIPVTTGHFVGDAPWDPISGWDFTSNLDSIDILTGDGLYLYKNNTNSITGSYGNIGTHFKTSFYTKTSTPATGSLGTFTGAASAVVWDMPINKSKDLTVEFSALTLKESVETEFHENFFSGVVAHGVYVGMSDKAAFLEIHPDGLKLHGTSGAIIPGDFYSKQKRIRMSLRGDTDNRVDVFVDDGSSLSVTGGLLTHRGIHTSSYVSFGAFPVTPEIWGTGAITHEFHDLSKHTTWYDSKGITGLSALEGQTLWDDIFIEQGVALTKYEEGFKPQWPKGTKQILTPTWSPHRGIQRYLGAFVTANQYPGGSTAVKTQYRIPDDNYGGSRFLTQAGANTTFNGKQHRTQFIDMSSVPLFNGLENKVQFLLQANSYTGAAPEITEIVVMAAPQESYVDISPNWKLSSLPKNVYFIPDSESYANTFPQPHYQDLAFVHNEHAKTGIPLDSFVPRFSQGSSLSGQVKEIALFNDTSSKGLSKIDDGVYGPAWRNFNKLHSFSGSFTDIGYRTLSTPNYAGELLGNFNKYIEAPGVTGDFTINYNVIECTSIDGTQSLAQKVTVTNYTGGLNSVNGGHDIGISLNSVGIPTGQGEAVGVVEGLIHIPKGPGVVVTLHEGTDVKHKQFLDGHNYREPKKFSCSAYYQNNHVTDVTNTHVSLGVLPRTVNVSVDKLDSALWGTWTDDLEKHRNDEFILYNITGYIADHCYVGYDVANSSVVRNSSKLDPERPIYSGQSFEGLENLGLVYNPINRSSAIFEGWFRPYGLLTGATTSKALLFETKYTDDEGLGMNVWLNRSGEPYLKIDVEVHTGQYGFTGSQTVALGKRTETQPICDLVTHGQFVNDITLDSDSETITWGEWNHIGVYMDQRAIGDKVHASDQPIAPGNRELIPMCGARTNRLYFEVNNKIVNSLDLSPNPYYGTGFLPNSISEDYNYPSGLLYNDVWPRFVSYVSRTENREINIGKHILCDFDHVRFGIRDNVDSFKESVVDGNRVSGPIFTPYDSPKMSQPRVGGIGHHEFAHLWRMDYPWDYQGWDSGYATNHLLKLNYTTSNDLKFLGVKSSKELIKIDPEGPRGRNAIRLGPGQSLVAPYCSFDERVFNGTGTVGIARTQWDGSSYEYRGNGVTSHAVNWSEALGDYWKRTTADGHLRMGGKFKLWSYPAVTGAIGDFISFNENIYDANSYGQGQVYLGVNHTGQVTFGTRATYDDDGSIHEHPLGPFDGRLKLNTDQWYDLALDANLSLGTGYIGFYVSGQLHRHEVVHTSINGALNSMSGRAPSYTARLPQQVNGFLAHFNIGGEPINDSAINSSILTKSWPYKYFDVSVSEVFVGFGMDHMKSSLNPKDISSWSWNQISATGQIITGHCNTSLINKGIKIAPIYGTGSTPNASFYTGVTTYPATDFSDAGENLLWGTALDGDDYEGIGFIGTPVYGKGLFNNAEAYHVIYDQDNSAEVLGSTDSPIQIANTVPPEGVNLSLISNKEWNTDRGVTTFDLSDDNYANITSKLQGETFARNFTGYLPGTFSGEVAANQLTSPDVRITSTTLWDQDSSNQYLGFFAHLVGGEEKLVYVPSTEKHALVTGDYDSYHLNLEKIQQSISVKNSKGEDIPFDEFPYRVIASPYSHEVGAEINKVLDSSLGFGATLSGNIVNRDQAFSVVLVARDQSIGDSVFIHYQSIDPSNDVINLQDSEIYNPIPLMRHVDEDEVLSMSGNFIAGKGTYSVSRDTDSRSYDLKIWHANLTGFADNI